MVLLENGTKQNEKTGAMELKNPSRRLTWELAAKGFRLRFVSYPRTLSVEVQRQACVSKL